MKGIPCVLLVLLSTPLAARDPALWPEAQRAFLQDGPAWLLPEAERARFSHLGAAERASFVEDFLDDDPLPETAVNELRQGIERRRAQIVEEWFSSGDDRARLLFLRGAPLERRLVDCREVFKPLEIWRFALPEGEVQALLYRLSAGTSFRLWTPSQGKRVLYTGEMTYLVEQWQEVRKAWRLGRKKMPRFDVDSCPVAEEIDDITGLRGLDMLLGKRPSDEPYLALLEPPRDLASWARRAAGEAVDRRAPLTTGGPEVSYPEERGLLTRVRLLVDLPRLDEIGAREVEGQEEREPRGRISVEGIVERQGRFFESFRMLFEPSLDGEKLPLAIDRWLRPEQSYVIRLQVTDEVSQRRSVLLRGFHVPREIPGSTRAATGALVPVLGWETARERVKGDDRVILTPPESPVVLGLWRAEALVSGPRIRKVVFYLDGTPQMTRTSPPFTAELRLPAIPREIVARAEAFDAEGALVDDDEIVLNQPTGSLAVRIVEPARGGVASGRHRARAEVVVPEGGELRQVIFRVAGEEVARLERPPWTTEIEVPEAREALFLEATAELADGQRAEDVRFLRLPYDMASVEVDLVELLTTVTDRRGTPVTDLTREDFRVNTAGHEQAIVRFEPVRDRPVSLGIAIDTSPSMSALLGRVQEAASRFVERQMRPGDRCFAVSFGKKPSLVLPMTDDPVAVVRSFGTLLPHGFTALHDALVFSLYHFRGVRGRRVLVVMTDGEDTASTLSYEKALAYAEQSGVLIYTIAMNLPEKAREARQHLEELSQATGGRAFFVQSLPELEAIYGRIAVEIRSQYLLAYAPTGDAVDALPEIEVSRRGLSARTVRNYVP